MNWTPVVAALPGLIIAVTAFITAQNARHRSTKASVTANQARSDVASHLANPVPHIGATPGAWPERVPYVPPKPPGPSTPLTDPGPAPPSNPPGA